MLHKYLKKTKRSFENLRLSCCIARKYGGKVTDKIHRKAQKQNADTSQLGCHCFGVESYKTNITVPNIFFSFESQSLQPNRGILCSVQSRHCFICDVFHQYHSPNLIHISVMKEKLNYGSRKYHVSALSYVFCILHEGLDSSQ